MNRNSLLCRLTDIFNQGPSPNLSQYLPYCAEVINAYDRLGREPIPPIPSTTYNHLRPLSQKLYTPATTESPVSIRHIGTGTEIVKKPRLDTFIHNQDEIGDDHRIYAGPEEEDDCSREQPKMRKKAISELDLSPSMVASNATAPSAQVMPAPLSRPSLS